jgi:thiol-disulfide isomerase/thioredoxin
MAGGLAAALSWVAPAGAETWPPVFVSGKHQFTMVSPRRMLPSIHLFSLAGGTHDLAGFRGQPILLNFWASWCAACRTELPTLDRLSERARRMRLHVLAVSADTESRDRVGRFVQSLEIRHLPIYLDPHGRVGHADPARTTAPFALYGMPVTYLIAASGAIIGYMPGAADWSDPAATALIEYLHSA